MYLLFSSPLNPTSFVGDMTILSCSSFKDAKQILGLQLVSTGSLTRHLVSRPTFAMYPSIFSDFLSDPYYYMTIAIYIDKVTLTHHTSHGN